MLTMPAVFIDLLAPFMPQFQAKTWVKAQLLLVEAVLSPGKRTVRQHLWYPWDSFPRSASPPDMVKIPRVLLSPLVDTVCYAA
jgi:hypothetical protein